MISYWLALAIVIIAFFYDVTSFKIPNWICILALSCGYCFSLYQYGFEIIFQVSLSVIIGFVPMWGIYFFKGIGAGDVKLFASLAAIIGIHSIIELMILSFLFGGAISVIYLGYITLRKLNRRMRSYYSHFFIEARSTEPLEAIGIMKLHQFPFMLAVAPAMLVICLTV